MSGVLLSHLWPQGSAGAVLLFAMMPLGACGDGSCSTLGDVCSYCDDLATSMACGATVSEGDQDVCSAVTNSYASECGVFVDEDGVVSEEEVYSGGTKSDRRH